MMCTAAAFRTATVENKARPLTMSDLEVRPGSPEPAVVTETALPGMFKHAVA